MSPYLDADPAPPLPPSANKRAAVRVPVEITWTTDKNPSRVDGTDGPQQQTWHVRYRLTSPAPVRAALIVEITRGPDDPGWGSGVGAVRVSDTEDLRRASTLHEFALYLWPWPPCQITFGARLRWPVSTATVEDTLRPQMTGHQRAETASLVRLFNAPPFMTCSLLAVVSTDTQVDRMRWRLKPGVAVDIPATRFLHVGAFTCTEPVEPSA